VRIGVLSDTHGKLDSRVLHLFTGVEEIIHAGDVGSKRVLTDLQAIAPTTAVLGNVDCVVELRELPLFADVTSGEVWIHIAHGHLQPEPATRIRSILDARKVNPPRVLILGHSHHPYLAWHGDVLVMNPGSASRPRDGFPASVGLLTIQDGAIEGCILDLNGRTIQPGIRV
jgi:uncharacterized protein